MDFTTDKITVYGIDFYNDPLCDYIYTAEEIDVSIRDNKKSPKVIRNTCGGNAFSMFIGEDFINDEYHGNTPEETFDKLIIDLQEIQTSILKILNQVNKEQK